MDKIDTLRDRVASDERVKRTVRRWAVEGRRKDVDWAIGRDEGKRSERRYALSTAALELAEGLAADDDAKIADDIARAALVVILGDDAAQPVLPVGGLIGTLTIDQARQLYRVARSHHVVISDDGTPRIVAA